MNDYPLEYEKCPITKSEWDTMSIYDFKMLTNRCRYTVVDEGDYIQVWMSPAWNSSLFETIIFNHRFEDKIYNQIGTDREAVRLYKNDKYYKKAIILLDKWMVKASKN